ncbi:hypothetical protein V8E55_010119 [Tylopilus felleus]
MVQIAPLLQAMSVTSLTPTDSTSNGLAVRQSVDFGDPPVACQSSCQVVNTMGNCDENTTCICASSLGSQLQQCMNCFVSNLPSVQSEAQSVLDSWNQDCGGELSVRSHACLTTSEVIAGLSSGTVPAPTGGSSSSSGSSTGSSTGTVPAPTGSSSSSSGGSPFGKSGGAVGLAACIVAAFAGALVSL